MKRSIQKFAIAAALVFSLGIGTSFAAPANHKGPGSTITLLRDFRGAQIISTSTAIDHTTVTFKFNGAVLTAFYNDNGDLIAVTHNITSDQLPIHLLLKLKHDYSSFWITDLFELNIDGSTSYYITLESSDSKLVLRSNEANWEVYSRTRQ